MPEEQEIDGEKLLKSLAHTEKLRTLLTENSEKRLTESYSYISWLVQVSGFEFATLGVITAAMLQLRKDPAAVGSLVTTVLIVASAFLALDVWLTWSIWEVKTAARKFRERASRAQAWLVTTYPEAGQLVPDDYVKAVAGLKIAAFITLKFALIVGLALWLPGTL